MLGVHPLMECRQYEKLTDNFSSRVTPKVDAVLLYKNDLLYIVYPKRGPAFISDINALYRFSSLIVCIIRTTISYSSCTNVFI